jgi:LAS superfamily LD-carboxypeptidase LdcB
MSTNFLEKLNDWPAIAIGIAVMSGVAYGAFYILHNLEIERARLALELESANLSNYELIHKINEKEGVIVAFQGQLSTITSTVGTLEKLASIDQELLAKYSKIYFLNENYIPKSLTLIDAQYLNKAATNIEIHTQVWPFLERLLRDANTDGQKLLVASAYRSFATQSSLKSAYTLTYGTGANKFSADQGYSEHQLGTALDFTTMKLGNDFSKFASESAYQWLKDNAYKYGFVLSYPEGNTYYKFEPWHWRFVGVLLATRLHEDHIYFYDSNQRNIDQYLVKLFD